MDFDSVYDFQLFITASIMCQKGKSIDEYLEKWQAIQSCRNYARARDRASFSFWEFLKTES